MAQKVFMHTAASVNGVTALQTNLANAAGTATGWTTFDANANQGSSVTSSTRTTVAGTTLGIEVPSNTAWMTPPLSADFTISGTVTFNCWARESNAMANTGMRCIVERINCTDLSVSTIVDSAQGTELATGTPPASARNWTATPTSTACNRGDRLRIRWIADDVGTMGSGYTIEMWYDAGTGVNGDTYVQFNENLTFETDTTPGGTQLLLTQTAASGSINPGSAIEYEAWTNNTSLSTSVVNTTAGWTAPIQWTDSAGGTAVEWYTRPLQAFTLAGMALFQLNAIGSSSGLGGVRVEVAVTDSDGTNAATWATACIEPSVTIGTTYAASEVWVAGDDTAVSDGQRLRIRVFADDRDGAAMTTGGTMTLRYGTNSYSYLELPQSVSEYTSSMNPRFLHHAVYSQAVNRSAVI